MSLSVQSCPLLGQETIAPLLNFESLSEIGLLGLYLHHVFPGELAMDCPLSAYPLVSSE